MTDTARAPQLVPTPLAAVLAIARVTLLRATRGRVIWVALCISLLPLLLAMALHEHTDEVIFSAETLMLGVLPPMFVASSIGEELEERTATYLWSRPLPRWTILAGKLLALVPLVILIISGTYLVAVRISLHIFVIKGALALALGALAAAVLAGGIATLAPKHGMSLSIIYLLFIDLPVGAIPAGIRVVSVTHDADALLGANDATSPQTAGIALGLIVVAWTIVAFRRISRIET